MKLGVVSLGSWMLSQSLLAWTLVHQEPIGWKDGNLTIYLNPDHCQLDSEVLERLLEKALGTWNGVLGVSIELSKSSTLSQESVDALIRGRAHETPLVLCDPEFSRRERVNADYVPALTRLFADGDSIVSAGIVLNGEPHTGAVISRLSEPQLTVVLAHELGHVLGLGHSSSTESLMYYSIRDKKEPTLSSDDIQGLQYLYPRNEFTSQPFSCNAIHLHRGENNESIAWAGLFLMGTLWLGRRVFRRC